MKTLGRILIILAVFAIVMGITYMAVNNDSSSTSTNLPVVERGNENFRPRAGERPAFEEEGRLGGGWMFGLVKNIGIVAVIVVLIAVPKSLMRRKFVPVSSK